ncbi:Hypothetical predicted protein [Marmota monax]|uniref:ZP domain-containing protein n=1 Tax=Marmota monax TaxID=9995 RepID=A0A5E4AL16_MARMO|nr:Hypothetical predicted protein [Marmota monax]
MTGRFYGILLLLAAATLGLGQGPFPKLSLPGLWHSYDCGIRGMQLRVVPRPGQTIRFKVLDEFGNRFEVNNCSVCYHWVTSTPQELAVFSADYRGCHVLEKDPASDPAPCPTVGSGLADPSPTAWSGCSCPAALWPSHLQDGRFHLRVFIEAVLPDGHVDIAQEATLICPKPDHTWTPDSSLVVPTTPSPSTPHLLPLRPTSSHPSPGSGYALPTPSRGASAICCSTSVDGRDPLPKALISLWGLSVPATIQCFRSGYFILVISQEMALARRIALANIHLAYAPASCPPTQETSAFVVFRVPLTHCGTTVQVGGRTWAGAISPPGGPHSLSPPQAVGNQLIYENQLVSDLDIQKGPQGSITRDSTFRLHVRCLFNAGDFLPIQASISPPPSPAPVTQSGPLRLELRIAKDETFSSYYGEDDYPLVRLLREPVHVEVQLLQRTDPGLVLVLHQCWATPSANPFQQPQWPILSDGCPFEGDSYRTQMVSLDKAELPFRSHYQRFMVATFAFLDFSSQRALRGPVYFFCSASACYPSRLQPCSPTCASGTASESRGRGEFFNPTPGLCLTLSPEELESNPWYGSFPGQDSDDPQVTTTAPSGPWTSRLQQELQPKATPLGPPLLLAAALVLQAAVSVGLRGA